jgi:hypothetical protein
MKFVKWVTRDLYVPILPILPLWEVTRNLLGALFIDMWILFVIFSSEQKSQITHPVLWTGVGILGTLFVLSVASH